jgi:penicillin amidase
VLDKNSVAAGIYEAWYSALTANVINAVVPAPARSMVRGVPSHRIIEWLTAPSGDLGANPLAVRDSLLLTSLSSAVAQLTERQGSDMSGWAWGRYHQAMLRHPMSAALNAQQKAKFEVGPWPRGGDGNTVGATGGGEYQTAGASFRFIVEANDWDNALGTNSPGQSGDVNSPHYRDLFELWKNDRYFPVKFSRAAVEGVTEARTFLAPTVSTGR